MCGFCVETVESNTKSYDFYTKPTHFHKPKPQPCAAGRGKCSASYPLMVRRVARVRRGACKATKHATCTQPYYHKAPYVHTVCFSPATIKHLTSTQAHKCVFSDTHSYPHATVCYPHATYTVFISPSAVGKTQCVYVALCPSVWPPPPRPPGSSGTPRSLTAMCTPRTPA